MTKYWNTHEPEEGDFPVITANKQVIDAEDWEDIDCNRCRYKPVSFELKKCPCRGCGNGNNKPVGWLPAREIAAAIKYRPERERGSDMKTKVIVEILRGKGVEALAIGRHGSDFSTRLTGAKVPGFATIIKSFTFPLDTLKAAIKEMEQEIEEFEESPTGPKARMTMSEECIDYQSLIELTEPQEREFKQLKASIQRCKKENIFFYQVLDTLGGLNGNNIVSIEPGGDHIAPNSISNLSYPTVTTSDSWADDPHYVVVSDDKEAP